MFSNIRIETTIGEVSRNTAVNTQQLAVANERAYMERKYHSKGQVRIVSDDLFPVLAIHVTQFRAYRRCDIHFLRLLKTKQGFANGRPTEHIYAADIKGTAVTVVMKRIHSETMDDTLNVEDTRPSSEEEGGSPTDLTILKRVL